MTNNRHFFLSWSIEWFCVWIKICVSTATFLPQTVFIYKYGWKITEWQNHTWLWESNEDFDSHILCVYILYIFFFIMWKVMYDFNASFCATSSGLTVLLSLPQSVTSGSPKLIDLCQFSVGAWRLGQWSPPGTGASYVQCNQLWQRFEEKVDCRQCVQTAPQGRSSCFHKFCNRI